MAMTPTGIVLDTGDIVRLVVYTKIADQAGLNVLHYQVIEAAGTGAFDMSLMGDSWAANSLPAKYRTALNESAEYLGIGLRRVWPEESIEFIYESGGGVGDGAGDALPTQVCGLIRKRSGEPGHGRGGRIYIQFASEGDSQGLGAPRVEYLDKLQDLVDGLVAFRNIEVGKTVNMVMYRYPQTEPEVIERRVTPVERLSVQAKWATQRRRGAYGRPNVLPV